MSGPGHNNPPPVSGSFIVYHREWIEHPLVGRANPEYCAWWIDLLCACNYQDSSINVNGYRFDLRAGEMVGAVSFLAHRWNVGPRRVRTYLDHLVAWRLITLTKRDKQTDKQKGKAPHVINIMHFNELEIGCFNQGQANRQAKRTQTDKQPTSNRQEPNHLTIKPNNTHTSAREPDRASPPHMNGVGFVVSKAWDISIPHEIVQRWRTDYPNIPNLEVELKALAVSFMGNSTACQRFRDCPEHWFERILVKENAKASPNKGKRAGQTMRKLLNEKAKTGGENAR